MAEQRSPAAERNRQVMTLIGRQHRDRGLMGAGRLYSIKRNGLDGIGHLLFGRVGGKSLFLSVYTHPGGLSRTQKIIIIPKHMSLIRFLVVVSIGTALSWVSWVMIITSLDPSGGGSVLALFYLSLFLALMGSLTIIGFFLRYWLEADKVLFQQIAVSLRQASLLSGALVLALMLQAARWLNVWTLIILLLLAGVIEMFFLAGQTQRARSLHPSS
ncbi:MAG: hypothetical protein HY092_01125 [Candidatus Kerfeldbacteria bacterium]|nr:hypothetical protein [Candidatus Kerfeldbacteria bacterium]